MVEKASSVTVGSPRRQIQFFRSLEFVTGLILVASCLLQIGFYQRLEDYRPDSSYYIGLAQSILVKHAYVFDFKPHVIFPPGFPAILALISLVCGASYKVYIRWMPLFGLVGLLLSYSLVRREEGKVAACVMCLVLATSPGLFLLNTQRVFSDMPYFAASMLALVLAKKADGAKSRGGQFGWAAAFSVAVVVSLLIRSAGMALLGGLFLWLVSTVVRGEEIRRRLRVFLPALILGSAVQFSWLAWTKKAEVRDSPADFADYVSLEKLRDPHHPDLGPASLRDLLARPVANLPVQAAHTSELVLHLNWVSPIWISPLVLGPLLVGFVGLCISFAWEGGCLEDWYLLCYLALYLNWPFDDGTRFMLPVFPLIWLYLWRGGRWLAQSLRKHGGTGVRWAFALSISLFACSAVTLYRGHWEKGIQNRFPVVFWGGLALILAAWRWTSFSSWLVPRSGPRAQMEAAQWGEPNIPTIVSVAGWSVLILLTAFGVGQQIRFGLRNLSPDSTKFVHYPSLNAGLWIDSNTAADDVLMAGWPAILYRVTGRRIVQFPVTIDASLIHDTIKTKSVKFLVVMDAPRQTSYYLPTEADRFQILSESFPNSFLLVHTGPGYHIFRVLPQGNPALPPSAGSR